MLAYAQSQDQVFGMITSGGSFMFIKLVLGLRPVRHLRYFDIRNRGNELYNVSIVPQSTLVN